MTNPTWITDRRPTEADGDRDGYVCMERRPGHRDNPSMVHWSHVGAGIPWRHTVYWKPPVPVVKLPGINGQWIDGGSVLPTREHADRVGDVQVRDAHGRCSARTWSAVGKGDTWRPYSSKDTRPVELARAEGTLPGFRGDWILGAAALPTREYADQDGDVEVPSSFSGTYRRWDLVGCGDAWKPRAHLDNRPQR